MVCGVTRWTKPNYLKRLRIIFMVSMSIFLFTFNTRKPGHFSSLNGIVYNCPSFNFIVMLLSKSFVFFWIFFHPVYRSLKNSFSILWNEIMKSSLIAYFFPIFNIIGSEFWENRFPIFPVSFSCSYKSASSTNSKNHIFVFYTFKQFKFINFLNNKAPWALLNFHTDCSIQNVHC